MRHDVPLFFFGLSAQCQLPWCWISPITDARAVNLSKTVVLGPKLLHKHNAPILQYATQITTLLERIFYIKSLLRR